MYIQEIRDRLIKGEKITNLPLKVTFYGRVSTDDDIQLSSLEHQIEYFTAKINENKLWKLVNNGYIDEGITGTSVSKRKAFLQMIEDAKDGQFDLILTKEVSRFARDIVDSITYTRELLKYNVGVFFEDIGLNTMETDAEFRLSIMATVAQEESRKISQRVKFGYKQANKNGVRHGGDAPIGYLFNNENNGYIIDPVKKDMISYLFNRYAEDKVGIKCIASELFNMGYKSETGTTYSVQTLRRIIRHPVYTGNIVNGKSSKPSYRETRIDRKPTEEWILVHDEDRVPPLVDQSLWDKCNSILKDRGRCQVGLNSKTYTPKGTRRYAYSGRIRCAEHNKFYHHTRQCAKADGTCSDYYRCPEYKSYGVRGCSAPYLYTRDLNKLMRQVFLSVGSKNTDDACKSIIDALKKTIETNDNNLTRNELLIAKQKLLSKKQKLFDGWINSIIDDATYKKGVTVIDDELRTTDIKLEELVNMEDSIAQTERYMDDLRNAVSSAVELEDDSIVEMLSRRYLKEIVVRNIDGTNNYALDVYLYGKDDPYCRASKSVGRDIVIPSPLEPTGLFMLQKGIMIMNFDFTVLKSIKPSVYNRTLLTTVFLTTPHS